MIFQSRWRNYTFIARRTTKTIHPEWGPEIKPGLPCKFKGAQRIFDSTLAQRDLGWSDEERKYVENKLLGHKYFGRGIYLGPGEIMTPGMAKNVKNTDVLVTPRRRCLENWVEDYNVIQCSNDTAEGQDFCDDHAKDKPKIQKGLGTTKDV